MNNLSYLPLLEQYIAENGANSKFNVPFLARKNKYNVELQNWDHYQDLRKGIITIRQSGIRVKAPDYYPCLTNNPVIPIIYEWKSAEQNGYRYLNRAELLSLQSFPKSYQFPQNYSLTKIAALLGNSVNVETVKHFIQKQINQQAQPIYESKISGIITASKKEIPNFVDLFGGIGGIHLALQNYSRCVLALDKSKSCAETYRLNFPNTPFLLGDINDKKVQKQIIETEFDLLCAGFPCQPFSKANSKPKEISLELTSLLKIIQKKKPKYLLLENVPNFLLVSSSKFLLPLLKNYHCQISLLNPLELGIKHNRPRLFIWGQKNFKNYE